MNESSSGTDSLSVASITFYVRHIGDDAIAEINFLFSYVVLHQKDCHLVSYIHRSGVQGR